MEGCQQEVAVFPLSGFFHCDPDGDGVYLGQSKILEVDRPCRASVGRSRKGSPYLFLREQHLSISPDTAIVQMAVEFPVHGFEQLSHEIGRRFVHSLFLPQDALPGRMDQQVGQLEPGDIGGLGFQLQFTRCQCALEERRLAHKHTPLIYPLVRVFEEAVFFAATAFGQYVALRTSH